MIERAGSSLKVTAPMLYGSAPQLLAAGKVLLASGVDRIDLGAVGAVDSSALAILLAWVRLARARGQTLSIENPSPSLLSLVAVHGVDELLPFA